jgi:hypothetical protein
MAGAILISEAVGVSLGTFPYRNVVEALRPFLEKRVPALIEELYDPSETFNFIDVGEWSAADFREFIAAAEEAFKDEMSHPEREGLRNAWQEVLQSLHADPRASQG